MKMKEKRAEGVTGGRRKERVVMSEEGIVESKGRRREGEEVGSG